MYRHSAFHKSFTLLFIVSATVAFAGYTSLASAQHVTDGLELYIPFDADTCAGDTCDDLAGNHDAIFNFPIKHVPGQVNEAVEFNSENGHFALTDLLINSNEFESLTMEAWANPYMEHEAFGAMMGGDDGGWDRGYGYRKDLWEVQVGKGGEWQPGPEAVLNTWQHTVVIYTPDLVIFYWNGDRYEFDEADPDRIDSAFHDRRRHSLRSELYLPGRC